MKLIYSILTSIVLLPITGCVFPGNRDHSDDRRSVDEHHDDQLTGVDHGEHPGDTDHQLSH